MEITVISEEENPMLHRTDVQFRVSHAEATPDRLAVRDSLAARLNKDADEVVIRRLDTKFGMRETVGEAKVYQGAEFATDVEQEHMLARNKIGDAAVVGEAAESEGAETDEGEVPAEPGEPAEPEAESEEGSADEEDEAGEVEADDEAEETEGAEADDAEAGVEEAESEDDEETEE